MLTVLDILKNLLELEILLGAEVNSGLLKRQNIVISVRLDKLFTKGKTQIFIVIIYVIKGLISHY